MTDKRFQVGIVGGGIGGLALAQGLKKAGTSVAVYERDRTPTDRLQGYRVHISPKGSEALHQLPAGRAFRNVRGHLQRRQPGLPLSDREDGGTAVHRGPQRCRARSRNTARRAASPCGRCCSAASTASSISARPSRATRRPPTGRSFSISPTAAPPTCDVLVGADGGNSRVRQQFLPHARRIDTGVVGIAAKAMLTEENRRRLAAARARKHRHGDVARPARHVHRPARIR